jgi:hypothetical protein
MRVTECSTCRRSAAWLIDTEVFCEGHKELIIEAAGVDRFRIRRLTKAERAINIPGRKQAIRHMIVAEAGSSWKPTS